MFRAMASPAGAFSGADAVGVLAIGEDGTGALRDLPVIEIPPTAVIEASIALVGFG